MSTQTMNEPHVDLPVAAQSASKPPKKFKLIVIAGDEDKSEDVWAATNGDGLWMKRNEEIVVPEHIVTRLTVDAYAPSVVTIAGASSFTKPKPRYNVNVKGDATEAEFLKMLAERRFISRTQMPRVSSVQREVQMAMAATNL